MQLSIFRDQQYLVTLKKGKGSSKIFISPTERDETNILRQDRERDFLKNYLMDESETF